MSDRLAPKPVPRRDFLGLAGLWAAGLAVFGSLLGMARLAKPSVLPEASKKFRVGRPEDFAVDGAKIVPGRNVHLVAKQGGVAALSLVCTHLGCIVNTTETGYSCPCHGSVFNDAGDWNNIRHRRNPRIYTWHAGVYGRPRNGLRWTGWYFLV